MIGRHNTSRAKGCAANSPAAVPLTVEQDGPECPSSLVIELADVSSSRVIVGQLESLIFPSAAGITIVWSELSRPRTEVVGIDAQQILLTSSSEQ